MFIATGLKASIFPIFGLPPIYEAVLALVVNLLLAIVFTPIFEAIGAKGGKDATAPADYDEDLVPVAVTGETREALG